MVLDTSAAVALMTGEAHGAGVAAALGRADRAVMSAATLVELSIVLETKLGPVGGAVVERFLRTARIEVLDVDRDQSDLAVDAWRRFGRGRHRASLNYGDCFTYALARAINAPILCIGADFPATDAPVVAVDPGPQPPA